MFYERYVRALSPSTSSFYHMGCCYCSLIPKKFHPAGTLSLKMLTLKLVILSALVSVSRCSYLYQFDLKYHYIKEGNYFFVVAGLVKGSWPKKPHLEICLPSLPDDPALCTFCYCQEYIRTTQTHRPDSSGKDLLFLSYIKPHKPVKICTIAWWPSDGWRKFYLCQVLTFHNSLLIRLVLHLPLQHYESSRLDPSIYFQEASPEATQGFLSTKNFVICKYHRNPQLKIV